LPEIELREEIWKKIVKIAEQMEVTPEIVVDLALSFYISENWEPTWKKNSPKEKGEQ
jgi:hypothetical protein